MRLTPWTTTSLAIAGHDLACVRLQGSPAGVRVTKSEVIRSFLSLSPGEQRSALAGFEPGRSGIELTIPADWAAIRPIALSTRSWPGAKQEILRSVESLFPFSRRDALVGLVERDAGGSEESAYLVGADAQRLEPWRRAIAQATGVPIRRTLSAHMDLLGLGLQPMPEATVGERTPAGATLLHELRYGRIVELGRPGSDDARVDAWLPASGADGRAAMELAIAGCLAPRVAPGDFAPLEGEPCRAPRRWIAPVAMSAASLAMIVAASAVLDGRYGRAAERLRAESQEILPLIDEVQRDRGSVRAVAELMNETVAPTLAGWGSVLPELAEAQDALPPDAFLYRVELGDAGVTIKGEADRASDVLTGLERSPIFTRATSLEPSFAIDERDSEQFHVRATRTTGRSADAERRPR